jgi:hypothetical protein
MVVHHQIDAAFAEFTLQLRQQADAPFRYFFGRQVTLYVQIDIPAARLIVQARTKQPHRCVEVMQRRLSNYGTDVLG